MSLHRANLGSGQDNAVLGQPIGLLVILIIATAIIALFCLSAQNLMNDSQIHQVEHQIDTILTEAANMFEYADDGSQTTIHIQFPASLRFIVFGSLPRNGTVEPIDLTLDENSSNNYYYVMDDGAIRTFHSTARFSDHNFTQIALFHSGSYFITMELFYREGKTYVALS